MLKGVKHHQSQLPKEEKEEGWGSWGNTLQLTAQQGTCVGGSSYSHAQQYHAAYRTETTARAPGGHTPGRLNPSRQGSAERQNHLQWPSPTHCPVTALSGPSHTGQASELQLAT